MQFCLPCRLYRPGLSCSTRGFELRQGLPFLSENCFQRVNLLILSLDLLCLAFALFLGSLQVGAQLHNLARSHGSKLAGEAISAGLVCAICYLLVLALDLGVEVFHVPYHAFVDSSRTGAALFALC